jgi:hypothetical protein
MKKLRESSGEFANSQASQPWSILVLEPRERLAAGYEKAGLEATGMSSINALQSQKIYGRDFG